MKKQESKGKALKWILPGAVLAVALAAAVLILALGGYFAPEPAEPADQSIKLYWNVDRNEYVAKGVNGSTGRMARSDGYYWIRFAVEGEQVDIPVADRALADQIDMLDVMGLVLDDQGVAIDVLDVHEFTGGLAVDHCFVEAIEGTAYTCNTSGLYKGVSFTVEIPQTANIYNVGGEGLLVGIKDSIQLDDELIAIQDENGVITDVFVIPYEAPGDIYWNVSRQYNSTVKMTTRQTNVLGYYEFQMCYGGQIITLKTSDVKVASAVDSFAAQCMGLLFDEDGNISGTVGATATTGGSAVSSWCHVTDVTDDSITTQRMSGSGKGNIETYPISRYCKTVLTSTGEYTQAQEGDLVHCLTDVRGRLAYIFVISRKSPTARLYWNVERKYDSANKVTTRVPAGDGYYYITLACEGQQVTLKTKDKDIATRIDSSAAKCIALEVQGDEIISVHTTGHATGGNVVMSWYNVDSISDGTITATKRTDEKSADYGNTENRIMTADCKVYNVSSTAPVVGQETTVQVGDTIHCMTNYKGELIVVFVVNRPVHAKIYYNLERMYDSQKKVTTRQKAADGYYYFQMAVDGKQVTLKTKSKTIATEIDARAGKCMGLSVSGDVIVRTYATNVVKGYTGGIEVSYCDITSINGRTAIAQRVLSGADQGKKYTVKMAYGCQVFNVSTGYESFMGEATALRVGDRVHCLMDENKNTVLIYVVERKLDGVVGWNISRQWDSENKITKRVADEEGWYYIDMAVDGQRRTLKTQDIEVVNAIDSAVAMCRGLVLDGDIIKRAVSPSVIKGTDGGVNGSWVTVTQVNENGCKAVKLDGAEAGTAYEIPMAADCKVYNVSSVVKSHKGEETTVKYGAVIHALINTDGEATVIYVISEGIEGAFGGHCEVCQQDVTWAVWDGTAPMVNNVHYYLEEDIHLDTYTTLSGIDVTLFLNGHTITGDSRAFKLTNSAVLRIYDSKQDGSDMGGRIITKGLTDEEAQAEQKGINEGGVIMLWSSNVTFNLYSGTLQLADTHNAVRNGGVVTGAGVFNMYGGCVIGGAVTGNGGAVRLFGAKARFNLYDGTVSGGEAVNGGCIAAENGGAVNLMGGTVTGGDVSVLGTSSISLSGKVTVSQITLTDAVISVGQNGLDDSASIGISDKNITTAFAAVPEEADKDCFYSAAENYAVEMDENRELYLKSTIPPHIHCECGGTLTDQVKSLSQHICDQETVWQAWGDDEAEKTTLPTSGSYYLADHVNLSSDSATGPCKVELGSVLNLCLNGFTITGKGRVFDLYGTLKLCDCKQTGVVIGNAEQKTTGVGGVVIVRDQADSALHLYGGTLQQHADATNTEGGVVYMSIKGSFNMYGGTVANGKTSGDGGNITVMDHAVFNLYGGTVTGGQGKQGGNIRCKGNSVVNIYGGSVTEGVAGTNGGNIYCAGYLSIFGGSVEHGSATAGGNLMVAGTCDISDGSFVGGSSTAQGGSIRIDSGTLNITGGTFTGGGVNKDGAVKTTRGGNLAVLGGAASVTGGTFTGGQATQDGGNIRVGKTMNLGGEDLRIENGQAPKGGNLSTSVSLSVNHIAVTGGKADKGGAIYIDGKTVSLTLSGNVRITGNTNAAGTQQNNVYLLSGQTIKLGTLAADATLGVTMEQPGNIATGVAADVSKQVTSDSDAYTVKYDAEQDKLYLQ